MQLASSEILIQLLWGRWEALANLTRRGPLPRLCSHIGGFPDEERNGQCPGMLAGRGKEVPACPSQGDSYICVYTHTHIHIYTYTYIHTHTHIYIHTHTPYCPSSVTGGREAPPPKASQASFLQAKPCLGPPSPERAGKES